MGKITLSLTAELISQVILDGGLRVYPVLNKQLGIQAETAGRRLECTI